MTYQIYRMANGIRIIHKHTHSAVAHCGLVINAGSRDELSQEHGLAHFIEHVVFKGTTRRKAHHILSHMENVGGELNAYTSKEDTCIYASFMHQWYARWMELLSDILFNSRFPARELEKEKEIIADEINSYKDSPGEQIFDDFDSVIFKDHPLGRNILGTRASLKRFDSEFIETFMARNYQPEEMVIASVGQIPFEKLVKLCEKYFSQARSLHKREPRRAFTNYTPDIKQLKRRNHQVHCMLGNHAYAGDHPGKTALVLLNNMLGGPGMNSRLNMAVRERYGYCYSIESHYQPYADSGIFSIYFGTTPGYTEKTLGLIHRELQRLREKPLGNLQLQRARQQLTGQIAISLESNLSEMLSMGKSLLQYNKVDDLDEINRKIQAVSAEELLEVARDILDPSKMSMLIFSPGKTPEKPLWKTEL